MPGTFAQLAFSSIATNLVVTVFALRWLANQAGLGNAVSGARSTDFSMPSSIEVLCTNPLPL